MCVYTRLAFINMCTTLWWLRKCFDLWRKVEILNHGFCLTGWCLNNPVCDFSNWEFILLFFCSGILRWVYGWWRCSYVENDQCLRLVIERLSLFGCWENVGNEKKEFLYELKTRTLLCCFGILVYSNRNLQNLWLIIYFWETHKRVLFCSCLNWTGGDFSYWRMLWE